MGWDLFGGSKRERLDLEKLAKEAIGDRKIPFLDSPPGDGYRQFTIKGVGDSEDDDQGALSRFIYNLDSRNPSYVYDLQIGSLRDSRTRENKRLISVTAYEPRSSQAA